MTTDFLVVELQNEDASLEVFMDGAKIDPETTMKSAGLCAGAHMRYDPDLARISIGIGSD